MADEGNIISNLNLDEQGLGGPVPNGEDTSPVNRHDLAICERSFGRKSERAGKLSVALTRPEMDCGVQHFARALSSRKFTRSS
jgi:hypothetical protein